jgi:tRNA pseudouridine38-40 synthase
VNAPDNLRHRVAAGEIAVRLTLQYDGSGFAGWQLQPRERTVQGELESALARLTDRPARVAAAGRTDRGVHAAGQVVSAAVPAKWQPAELQRALNAVLPSDIWVVDAGEADAAFHARFSAVARGYVYRVATTPAARSPFLRRWCWPLGRPLELAALDALAGELLGEHSFRAFAKAGQPERGERCTVHRSSWRAWGRRGVEYIIVANRFLHHMVRYLVGTMVAIALGQRGDGDLKALLAGGTPLETSPPAPPAGLFLARVYYPDDSIDEDTADAILP